MGLTDKKWFIDLKLSESDFSSCPAGADELVWALDSNVVNEDKYAEWASNHYLLPELSKEFFSMAVDQHLCEKYQDIHPWSENFFPIYEWESVLYVSCIEPVEWNNAKDVCQLIAPRSAMKLLWSKVRSEIKTTEPAPAEPRVEQAPPAPETAPPPIGETTSSLDFSTLGDTSSPKMEAAPEPPPSRLNKEETLNSLSFGDLDSTAKDAPPPPIDDDATPLPEIPLATAAPSLPLAEPKSHPPIPQAPNASPASEINEAPIISTPQIPPANEPHIPTPVQTVNSTIPGEHLIQASDLLKAKELGQCSDVDQVVLHIFSHIHKDFKKLMWVRKKKDKVFSPELVYGDWSMDTESWSTPVEVEKPNIFRIAWNSRLPFHGKISNNATNQNYFDMWNEGDIPEHMTIFPLLTSIDQCEGFIVGCGHGDEFDNHHSYKKLENLVSLSHKQLTEKGNKAS